MNVDVHFRETHVTLGGVGGDILFSLAILSAIDLVKTHSHEIVCLPQQGNTKLDGGTVLIDNGKYIRRQRILVTLLGDKHR